MPHVRSQPLALLFAVALLLQAIHSVEHFTQLYQFFVLRLPAFESHGIVFFLDLEWNHFVFNLAYFLLLFFILLGYRFFERAPFSHLSQLPRYGFLAAFAIQGYHVLEHTARIGQMFQSGCTPCQGILGWYINPILLHFGLVFVALLLPAFTFLAYRYWQDLWRKDEAMPLTEASR